jgi:Protein of unknown function (DUF3866)
VISWRDGTVWSIRREWPGALELEVAVGGEPATQVRALAYPALTGRPEPGDRVLLNTSALDLGLGTGGYALVVAVPDRLPPDRSGPGHLVKARYTPLQAIVLGADEQGSPYHETLRTADDIGAMPVVVADLHSALAPVLAGLYFDAERTYAEPSLSWPGPRPGPGPAGQGPGPGARTEPAPDAATGRTGQGQPGPGPGPGPGGVRVAYVMTDGGALPAWFSRTCATLREAGWLAGTITVGQAFGGDLEAVTLHSGLLAARHVLGADVAVVTQGPGNLGTGTRWGFSGVAAGEAVNAAAVLAGRPVAALRVSEADPRERHRGVSHHSLTSYGRVALAHADVVVPILPGDFGTQVTEQARPLGGRHTLVHVGVTGLDEALRACPAPLSTMGRGLDEDRAYFLTAATAGRHAAGLLRNVTMAASSYARDGRT